MFFHPPQWAFPQDGARGSGKLTVATPRDRNGTFEPQLIGKHQELKGPVAHTG
jgi:hypothetical protein